MTKIVFHLEDGSQVSVPMEVWESARCIPKNVPGHYWTWEKPRVNKPFMQMVEECKSWSTIREGEE